MLPEPRCLAILRFLCADLEQLTSYASCRQGLNAGFGVVQTLWRRPGG